MVRPWPRYGNTSGSPPGGRQSYAASSSRSSSVGEVDDGPRAVGGAVDGVVVDHHDHAVGGDLGVELEHVDAQRDGAAKACIVLPGLRWSPPAWAWTCTRSGRKPRSTGARLPRLTEHGAPTAYAIARNAARTSSARSGRNGRRRRAGAAHGGMLKRPAPRRVAGRGVRDASAVASARARAGRREAPRSRSDRNGPQRGGRSPPGVRGPLSRGSRAACGSGSRGT
jgi:hypothetical protein